MPYSMGIQRVGSSFLHTGHVLWSLSHGLIQSGWNICPHGKKMPFTPISKSLMQTEHAGISTCPPSPLLQCLSSMGTSGRRWTKAWSVGRLCASSSAIAAACIRWFMRFANSSKLMPLLPPPPPRPPRICWKKLALGSSAPWNPAFWPWPCWLLLGMLLLKFWL